MTFSVPRPQPILTGKSRHFLTLFGWIFLNIFPSAKQEFFFLFFFKKMFIRKPLCPLWPGQTFWQTDKFLQIFVTPGSSSHLLCACARCVPPHFNLAGDNWRLLIRLEFTYQTGGWWGFKPRWWSPEKWLWMVGYLLLGGVFSNGLDTNSIPTHAIQVRSVTVGSRLFGYLNSLEVQF